ncbi:MAG: DNA cytosine methyltransferase [Niveispirillum sp.]|nr:DNA cytosine methyltransferase [Niveispirillum sp.]
MKTDLTPPPCIPETDHTASLFVDDPVSAVVTQSRNVVVPVIDIFAGPGGLGEGFSRMQAFCGGPIRFKVNLSIEKDDDAVRTLRLRAYFRQFDEGKVPEVYYDYVRATKPADQAKYRALIEASAEWHAAEKEVWHEELGVVDGKRLHDRIRTALDGAGWWVLAGGPPCQAYSVVGRSRRIGVGYTPMDGAVPDNRLEGQQSELKARKLDAFLKDERHRLYREYLEIVAIHQPPVFVMENVKGILSSKIHLETDSGAKLGSVFDQILSDLRDPWGAIDENKLPADVELPTERCGYKIRSFVVPPCQSGEYTRNAYLIRAEECGVPQERHRVILLGIREDVDVGISPLIRKIDKSVALTDVIGGMPSLRSGRSRRKSNGDKNSVIDTTQDWLQAIRNVLPEKILDQIQEPYRSSMREVRDRIDADLNRGGRFLRCPSGLDHNVLGDLGRWLDAPELGGVLQHEARDHMDSDFARYLFVACYGEINSDSPKLRDFPKVLLPNHKNARTEEGRRIFHDRFRVQLRHKPASTITSHIRKDGHYFIHFDRLQCRSLTVREAARVQTFPDNYFFEGNRTAQYEQVGNAVPPYLALQLAKAIAEFLIDRIIAEDGRELNMAGHGNSTCTTAYDNGRI